MTDQLLELFWSKVKVDESTGCWNWVAHLDKRGYGHFKNDENVNVLSHRFAYEVNKGKIPEGLVLDHLCRNTKCVNPDHLEAITQRENILRGIGPAANNSKKTHCINGHEFTPENTYIKKNGRACKTCLKNFHLNNRPRLLELMKKRYKRMKNNK